MKYNCTVISVADIKAARKFYEDLFGLEVFQDYGRNIAFTCGLALQQDFDWLVHLPKESILRKSNNVELCFEEQDFDSFLHKLKKYPNIDSRFYDLDGHIIEVGENMKIVIKRFLASGMTIDEVSVKMDVSFEDLTKLLNS